MSNRAKNPPPTIVHLKAQGVTGVCSFCRACGHSGAVAFDVVGLLDRSEY